MELDHVFICVSPGAPEAETLIEFGFTEGLSNHHPGQGTANRRFFFKNAFLELIYLTDKIEATSEATRRTGLFERITDSKASPFGFCFRATKPNETVPFDAWQYQPGYFPEGVHVDIADTSVTEPLWFFMETAQRPDPALVKEHNLGVVTVTDVRVGLNTDQLSDAAVAANRMAGFEVNPGEEALIELSFDDSAAGKSHDFRPALPLVIRW